MPRGSPVLQHQAGMGARVDPQRFGALSDDNAVLALALGAAQTHHQRQPTTG